MTQRTGSEPIDKSLRDLLRDTSISSRALAFMYAVWLLADGESEVLLERRAVEITTGMDHTRWPKAEAKALGTYLDPERRGSNRYVDGHGEAGTWVVSGFAPITTPCVCPSSASLMHTTEVCGSGLDMQKTAVGGDGGVSGLAHPMSTVYDTFGQQRFDAWRLDCLVGARDVLVTAKDLTWMKRSAAYAFLARARAEKFVVDGLWLGTRVLTLVEEIGISRRVDRIRDRARKEVFANTEKLRLLMDRHAQLDLLLERMQPEYLALALERGSECAIEWALEMADPELRRAFAYGGQSQPEVVAW